MSITFHQSVTALAVAWTLMALVVLYCLSHRIFPSVLKYLSAGCDIVFLTAILMIAEGPGSPLVVGYFLLIALSALRFNLPLIRVWRFGARSPDHRHCDVHSFAADAGFGARKRVAQWVI